MHFNTSTALIRICASAAFLVTQPAFAAYLSDVSGTWSVVANSFSGTLTVSQGNATTLCKPIKGTIAFPGFATNTIDGYYCPSTGRIVFARVDSLKGPIQFYQGYTAVLLNGVIRNYIGGSFSFWNTNGNQLGDVGVDANFSAVK